MAHLHSNLHRNHQSPYPTPNQPRSVTPQTSQHVDTTAPLGVRRSGGTISGQRASGPAARPQPRAARNLPPIGSRTRKRFPVAFSFAAARRAAYSRDTPGDAVHEAVRPVPGHFRGQMAAVS